MRDGGSGGKLVTKDITGNPVAAETEGSQQMREAHLLDDKNAAVVSLSGKPGTSGAHNHEMGHTQGEDLTGSQGTSSRRGRRKRNARQQGVEVHPDRDESYVGDVSNIDDLVKYINNDISAANLKGNGGGNVSGLSDAPGTKATKKKVRNRVKILEAAHPVSETQGTPLSTSKNTSVNEADSEEPHCDTEIRLKMGNLSSSENLENNKEDGEHSSFSDIIAQESENDKKKKVRNETIKQESSKLHQKNNMMSNNASSNAKPSKTKNSNDRVKVEDATHKLVDDDVVKRKTSKKSKSKSVKKSFQELPKQVTSPAPPSPVEVIPMLPLEIPESVQEQWCTVQKKKRLQAPTSSTVQSSSFPSVAHQSRAKDSQTSSPSYPYDPHRRSRQYSSDTASSKATHSHPYLKTEPENGGKDLSPSDFPVLNSSPRDHGRSLENVFDTGSALIGDKDSDKESSKSFPADIGLADRSCKTKYPISYATMASGTSALESVDSSKAESVSSSDSSVEFSGNSSSLKWKGSPQERRHSIGSAPKEVSKGVLQRTGSQEMIHCDKDLDGPLATIPTNDGSCKNLVSSDSTGSFTSSEADSARGSEIGSDCSGEVCITTSTYMPSSSHPHVSAKNKQSNESSRETGGNVLSPSQRMTAAKSIPVDAVVNRSQTIRTESKASSLPGAKQIGNGRSKKGVVFCCDAGSLIDIPISGLHFGFFPEEESTSVVVSSNSTLNTPPPSVPSSREEVSNSVPEDNAGSSNHSDAGSSSVSSNNKPSKNPHISGLNGLVPPKMSSLVLEHSANSSVASEHSRPSNPAALVRKDSPSGVEGQDVSKVGSKVEENKVYVPFRRHLETGPPACFAYILSPEEKPAVEPSMELSESTDFLYSGWEKKNGEFHYPSVKVFSLKAEGIISPNKDGVSAQKASCRPKPLPLQYSK